MKIRRIFFLINSLWELLRFLLVYAAAVLAFRQTLAVEAQSLRWLLLLAAPGLVLPAGFLFVYLDPTRQGALLGALRLGKVLVLCAATVLILTYPLQTLRRGFGLMPPGLIPPAILAGTAAVDLALLIALLPPRKAKGDAPPSAP